MRRATLLVLFALLAALLAACDGGSPPVIASVTPHAAFTAPPSATPLPPTSTLAPTSTRIPTSTPAPSVTPSATIATTSTPTAGSSTSSGNSTAAINTGPKLRMDSKPVQAVDVENSLNCGFDPNGDHQAAVIGTVQVYDTDEFLNNATNIEGTVTLSSTDTGWSQTYDLLSNSDWPGYFEFGCLSAGTYTIEVFASFTPPGSTTAIEFNNSWDFHHADASTYREARVETNSLTVWDWYIAYR